MVSTTNLSYSLYIIHQVHVYTLRFNHNRSALNYAINKTPLSIKNELVKLLALFSTLKSKNYKRSKKGVIGYRLNNYAKNIHL